MKKEKEGKGCLRKHVTQIRKFRIWFKTPIIIPCIFLCLYKILFFAMLASWIFYDQQENIRIQLFTFFMKLISVGKMWHVDYTSSVRTSNLHHNAVLCWAKILPTLLQSEHRLQLQLFSDFPWEWEYLYWNSGLL